MNKFAVMCLIASVEATKITETREPLLTWAPTAKKGHPVDYFVPNFGNDHEMATQASNVAVTEAALKHTWTPKRDADDEKWVVPTFSEFKLINPVLIFTESHLLPGPQNLIKLDSKPIISSQTSVRTVTSVSLDNILQIPRTNWAISGTGLKPVLTTRRTTLYQTSEEIPISTTP